MNKKLNFTSLILISKDVVRYLNETLKFIKKFAILFYSKTVLKLNLKVITILLKP